MHLGRGVNIAPWSVRFEAIDAAAEFAGLKASGVEHVRIGGWIAPALQNWSTCPATTVRGFATEEAAVSRILAGEVDAPDPAARRAFWRLWLAAKAAVDAGLQVVLNPFHQRTLVEVSSTTVRWVWAAVLQEFSVDDFPVDRVAFEMVNEPANWTHATVVGTDWPSLVHQWVAQIHKAQPDRRLIITGVQGMRSGRPPSVNSLTGLVLDLNAGRLIPPACNGKCIVTFHYYEPRPFTTQSPSGTAWRGDDVALAQIDRDFASVANATPAAVQLYLGEYGLATAKVNVSEGVRWLAAVRRAAIRTRVAGYAAWAYHGTQNGFVAESQTSALERLCAWDRSAFAAAALGLRADGVADNETTVRCSTSSQLPSAMMANATANVTASSSRICPADGDVRPLWADTLVALAPAPRPMATLVAVATYIDVIGAVFLLGWALYCVHSRYCGFPIKLDGSRRNRLVAVRQTVQYNTNAPPPTVSPPSQLPTAACPEPDESQDAVGSMDAVEGKRRVPRALSVLPRRATGVSTSSGDGRVEREYHPGSSGSRVAADEAAE